MACCRCRNCCCGSINCCSVCVSPFDRCGNLVVTPEIVPPTIIQPPNTLSNVKNYAFLINPSVTLSASGNIPLTVTLLNGTNITVSSPNINLKQGNYEVIYSLNSTPTTTSLANGELSLLLNGSTVANSTVVNSYNNTNTVAFSGNVIVNAGNNSTLTLYYDGGVPVNLTDVKVTIKQLP